MNFIKQIRLYAIVIVLGLVAVQAQLQIELQLPESGSDEIQTLSYDIVPTLPNVSAILTSTRLVPCEAEDVTDAVVVCTLNLPLEAQLQQLADRGAAAVVFRSISAALGFTYFLREGKKVVLVLPSFEMHAADYDQLRATLEANVTALRVVLVPQTNEWTSTFASPGLYVMQIGLGLVSLGLIVFGAIKFRQVLRWFNGCRLSITLVLIWLEIIANFLRLLMLVDPLGFRIYSWNAQNSVSTLYVPFSVSSALLVTLYWHESLQLYSLKINPFLRKMFWPFMVIVLLALALEAAAIVVRVFVKNLFGTSFIIVYSYYLFILTGVIIFYSLTASRILRYMKKSEKLGKIWARRKRATVLMIVGGSGLILAVLATLASIVAFGTPTGWLVSTALTVVGFDICSCALLIAIRSGGTPMQSLNTSNKRASTISSDNTQHFVSATTHRSATDDTHTPKSFRSSPLQHSSPSNAADDIRPKLTETPSEPELSESSDSSTSESSV